jgi:hypothetical protein
MDAMGDAIERYFDNPAVQVAERPPRQADRKGPQRAALASVGVAYLKLWRKYA